MTARGLRRHLVLAGLAAAVSCGAAPAEAAAEPIWNLSIHHNPTHFRPRGTAEYWLDVRNIGETGSSGQITLTVRFPPGLTRNSVFESNGAQVNWSCPGSPGERVVICTTSDAIAHHQLDSALIVAVNVASESGQLTATASVEGGGAAAAASDAETAEVSSEPAGFGIVPGSFVADFFNADGRTPVRESGAHPYAATFALDLNTFANPQPNVPDHVSPAGNLRDLQVELPPGFVGDPAAIGECTPAELTAGACPASSQVGRVDVALSPVGEVIKEASKSAGVYNMIHPRGAIADLAFEVAGNPIHIKASLDPANGYAVKTSVSNVNETLDLYDQQLTIWGTPADSSHDWERCPDFSGNVSTGCSTDAAQKPFITIPSRCGVEQSMRLFQYDSWQNTGVFAPEVAYSLPGQSSGCEEPRFEPEVHVHPTSRQAASPTGLEVHVKVPQNENPNGLATPPVKRFHVVLPEGMTLSPSFADGLTGCSSQQIGLGTDRAVECPDSSRIGTVTVSTPLLPKPLEGSMYLASQWDNPFHSTFAMYLAIHDTEERGVLVKLPGRIELNEGTGQISSTFDDLPQFPFEQMTLDFRSGARAPLVNPPSCGAQTIAVAVSSWAQPEHPVELSNSYVVSEGANGTSCPANLAARPFGPQMDAGTLNPNAGSFSPFVFRLAREDQDQELSQIEATLPPGLVAKIAGVSECPAAAIASISEAEGSGRQEAESPACPLSSQIGALKVGVGSGPSPDYIPGKIYLAGPYRGAPLSLAIVVPAIAGPYDLGTVVVRAAVEVDPKTAQVRVVSDPLPTILHGILLRVKDIRLSIDRPEVTFNPTSCDSMRIEAHVTAPSAVADLANRFQVGNCATLGFKPSFSVSTSGKTSRSRGAGLHVRLTYPNAPFGTQANIRSVHVELPRALPSRLRTLSHACPDSVFDRNPADCPSQSRVGLARAVTPVLPVPMEGPAYFVSHGGQKFPELTAVLQGYGITLDLSGETFIGKTGITSSTFRSVPDVPIKSFELTLPEGEYSALAANTNLCAAILAMPTAFDAQNGARIERRTPIEVEGCPYALLIRSHRIHGHTVTLQVLVPASGRLTAKGKGLGSRSASASRRSMLTLNLSESRAGKLRTSVLLSFEPKADRQRKATGSQRKALRKSIVVAFR